MYTPLIAMAPGPSTASTQRYLGFSSGNSSASSATSAGFVAAPFAVAGTISNLAVSFPTTMSGSGTYTVGVVQNGSINGSFQCVMGTGVQTCTYSSTTISVSAGDTIAFSILPASTPTAQGFLQISATFAAASGQSLLFANTQPGATVSASVNNYAYFGGSNSVLQTSEGPAESVIATGGTIDDLYVATNATTGSGSYAITINHNGSATSLTCTINSASPCNDTTAGHAFTVAAGDTISVGFVPSSSPTARYLTVSVRWTPTINGEALLFATANTLPNTANTRYLNLAGTGASSGTEASFNNLAGSIFTVKKLNVLQQPQPGSGVTRTVTLRANAGAVGSPGNISCTVSAGTGATGTCSDTTNSYTTAASDLLDWQTSVSGTNTALTQFAIGAVAYQAP
jgi:hypothetical protein